MSALLYVNTTVIPAALSLLPEKMDSIPARAMLLAIGLQESLFLHRKQIGGPANGFWQGEKEGGTVKGVLEHPASKGYVTAILSAMAYPEDTKTVHEALVDNDILACVTARLLLWTHPALLPTRSAVNTAWGYYISCWRPGRPHPLTWPDNYKKAWDVVAPLER